MRRRRYGLALAEFVRIQVAGRPADADVFVLIGWIVEQELSVPLATLGGTFAEHAPIPAIRASDSDTVGYLLRDAGRRVTEFVGYYFTALSFAYF